MQIGWAELAIVNYLYLPVVFSTPFSVRDSTYKLIYSGQVHIIV